MATDRLAQTALRLLALLRVGVEPEHAEEARLLAMQRRFQRRCRLQRPQTARLHAHALGRPSIKPKAGTPVNMLYALSIEYMGALQLTSAS